MVERYLCLMLSGKIHGIDLSKLVPIEDEVEVEEHYYSEATWEGRRPPPPPLPPPSSFDFTIDLPAWDMQVFSLDSKIFLLGGSDDDDQPCYQIYEFQCDIAAAGDGNGDDENKKAELNLCESIPKVPVYVDFYNSHIAWIPGEAYFLACNDDDEWCFWVVGGCGGEWERLPVNTLLETQESLGVCNGYQRSQWFYSDRRLFLASWVQDNKSEHVLCCFDLQTRQWTMEEIHRSTSFQLCFNNEDRLLLLPRLLVSSVTGLEDYTNYSVMLSYSQSEIKRWVSFGTEGDDDPSQVLAITPIYAMLMNQNGFYVYQKISAPLLFKGIKPYFTRVKEIFFADLGEGKTCAMLFGFALQDRTRKTENIVLCASIFTLTLKDGFDIIANSVESWNKEQRFLSVRVLSSHVYTIKENLEDMSSMCKRREAMDYDVDIQQVFVCPPP